LVVVIAAEVRTMIVEEVEQKMASMIEKGIEREENCLHMELEPYHIPTEMQLMVGPLSFIQR
jgi:hypothetical protein